LEARVRSYREGAARVGDGRWCRQTTWSLDLAAAIAMRQMLEADRFLANLLKLWAMLGLNQRLPPCEDGAEGARPRKLRRFEGLITPVASCFAGSAGKSVPGPYPKLTAFLTRTRRR